MIQQQRKHLISIPLPLFPFSFLFLSNVPHSLPYLLTLSLPPFSRSLSSPPLSPSSSLPLTHLQYFTQECKCIQTETNRSRRCKRKRNHDIHCTMYNNIDVYMYIIIMKCYMYSERWRGRKGKYMCNMHWCPLALQLNYMYYMHDNYCYYYLLIFVYCSIQLTTQLQTTMSEFTHGAVDYSYHVRLMNHQLLSLMNHVASCLTIMDCIVFPH